MRQRRNKRVRKAVSFYKVCYQFREPFKACSRACRCLSAAALRACRAWDRHSVF